LPARRSRERVHREERRERLAPRVARTLALVAVVPARWCLLSSRRPSWRACVGGSAVVGERLSPAAKDAATVLLFTVVLPVAVAAIVVVSCLLGG
jgi:hypothetical protein